MIHALDLAKRAGMTKSPSRSRRFRLRELLPSGAGRAGRPIDVHRAVFFLSVLLASAACDRAHDAPPTATQPAALDGAYAAALERYGLPVGDRANVDVWLAGSDEAAIARDLRTGVCLLLTKDAADRWSGYAMFKGAPRREDLEPPLVSAGTAQEAVTRADLSRLAAEHCR